MLTPTDSREIAPGALYPTAVLVQIQSNPLLPASDVGATGRTVIVRLSDTKTGAAIAPVADYAAAEVGALDEYPGYICYLAEIGGPGIASLLTTRIGAKLYRIGIVDGQPYEWTTLTVVEVARS